MYWKYKCSNCEREELAHKTIHLEDQETVCSNCYYRAVDKLEGKALLTLKDIKNVSITEEAYTRARRELVNLLRRFITKHKAPPMIVMEDMATEEIEIADRYGKEYKDLNLLEKHNNIQWLKSNWIPSYFEDDSTATEMKRRYRSTEFFSLKDYEAKIRSLEKRGRSVISENEKTRH